MIMKGALQMGLSLALIAIMIVQETPLQNAVVVLVVPLIVLMDD